MQTRRMPHKQRVDTEDLEYAKGNDYFGVDRNYNGQPFTGFQIDGYYENGQIAAECEYVNGEQIGWDVRFFENGNVETESLSYGATSVYFANFNEDGTKIGSHFFAPEFLEEVCKITGEDPENVRRAHLDN
ncbi:hypothetical protein V3468_03425 [Flavobacterium oreochromis]|uniref:hypothetical protein n=1 Tax=Flavobacterium oreochromis TaxID=2906078 RepID=UPI003857FAF6